MTYMRTIKGRQVFVRVSDIQLLDEATGKPEGGYCYVSFRIDVPPSMMVDGETIKDEKGRTKIFTDKEQALGEGMAHAESVMA